MIDWVGVATNSLWLFGLAGVLATLSYYEYLAKAIGKPFRQILNNSTFVGSFSWAIALFCVGVAGSGGSWWQRVAWAVLAILFAVQAWKSREPIDSSQVQ